MKTPQIKWKLLKLSFQKMIEHSLTKRSLIPFKFNTLLEYHTEHIFLITWSKINVATDRQDSTSLFNSFVYYCHIMKMTFLY